MKASEIIGTLIEYYNVGPNWDGYGGIGPSMTTVDNVLTTLNGIDFKYLDYIDHIGLSPNGCIVVDFLIVDDLLSLEVGKWTMGYFTDGTHEFFVDDNPVTKKGFEILEKDLEKVLNV